MILFIYLSVSWIFVNSAGSTVVCTAEYFVPQCMENKVLAMITGSYGRMKQGRCIQTNNLIGCHNDATPAFDLLCSGKRTCSVLISNVFYNEEPTACEEYVTGYVDIEYECIKDNFTQLQGIFISYHRRLHC